MSTSDSAGGPGAPSSVRQGTAPAPNDTSPQAQGTAPASSARPWGARPEWEGAGPDCKLGRYVSIPKGRTDVGTL